MKHFSDSIKILFCLLILTGLGACNLDHHITPEEPALSLEDEAFLGNATYINLIGMEYAVLAEGRSSNGLILAYAQRMMEEHSAAGNVLGAMASDFEINIPQALPPQQQLERDQLLETEGPTFDSIYIQRNIENHLWSQEIMEDQINESNVEELVAYARLQLIQVNERFNDALIIQSELP